MQPETELSRRRHRLREHQHHLDRLKSTHAPQAPISKPPPTSHLKTTSPLSLSVVTPGVDISPSSAPTANTKPTAKHEPHLPADLLGHIGYTRYDAGWYVNDESTNADSGWKGRGSEGSQDRKRGDGGMLSLCTVLEDERGSKGRCVTGLKIHEQYEGILFSSHLRRNDGKFGEFGGTVCMWRMEEGRRMAERVLWAEVGVNALEVVGGGGGNVLMGGLENGSVMIWDTRVRSGGSVWGCVGSGECVVGIVERVGGGGLWSGSSGGELCEWQVGVGRVRRERIREMGGIEEIGICCLGKYGGRRGGLVAGGLLGGVFAIGIGSGGGGGSSSSSRLEVRKVGEHEGMVMGVEGHWGKGVLEEVVVSVGRDWRAKVWHVGGEGVQVGGYEVEGGGMDVGWSGVNGSVFGVGEEGGLRIVDWNGEAEGRRDRGCCCVGLGDGRGICKVGWGKGIVCGGEGEGRIGVWRCGDGFGKVGGVEWMRGWVTERMERVQ